MDRLFLFSTSRRGDRRDPSHEPKWGYAGPRMARMRLILTDTDGIVDSPKRDDWFVSSIRDSQGDPCHLASAVSAALRRRPVSVFLRLENQRCLKRSSYSPWRCACMALSSSRLSEASASPELAGSSRNSSRSWIRPIHNPKRENDGPRIIPMILMITDLQKIGTSPAR